MSANSVALNSLVADPLKDLIEDMDKFQQMIEQTLDLDAADRGEFIVKSEFSDALKGDVQFVKLSILFYLSTYRKLIQHLKWQMY